MNVIQWWGLHTLHLHTPRRSARLTYRMRAKPHVFKGPAGWLCGVPQSQVNTEDCTGLRMVDVTASNSTPELAVLDFWGAEDHGCLNDTDGDGNCGGVACRTAGRCLRPKA